jgi:hypothetical protein
MGRDTGSTTSSPERSDMFLYLLDSMPERPVLSGLEGRSHSIEIDDDYEKRPPLLCRIGLHFPLVADFAAYGYSCLRCGKLT